MTGLLRSWLLREPLVRFLAGAALIFAAHAAVETADGETSRTATIRLRDADAAWLREMWARQWGRPPTDEEMTRLVADHLREEVLAREAKALDLDVGDTVVRRRLAQKMAFIVDGTIRVADPTEAELRALYEKRSDLVLAPARVSFTQVFFRDDAEGEDRARASLAALSDAGAVPPSPGDRLLLGDSFADQDERAVTNLFGPAFARAIFDLPVGRWAGPVASSYGLHLVRVAAATPARARPFDEVRERLSDEWRRERQEAAQAQLLDELIRKYEVTADPALRPWLGSLASRVAVAP